MFIGKVWPGNVAFPDFTDQRTGEYWKKQVLKLTPKLSMLYGNLGKFC